MGINLGTGAISKLYLGSTEIQKAYLGGSLVYDAGGAAWQPTDLANLVAWYDPSDVATITESGGFVSQLDDKSGNGNHVVQPTGASQPITGTQTINGLNVLEYVSDFLANSAIDIGTSGDIMIACLVDVDETQSASLSSIHCMLAGQTYQFQANASGTFTGAINSTNGTLTLLDGAYNNTHIFILRWDFTSGVFDVWVDGVQDSAGTGTYSTKYNQIADFKLMSNRNTAATQVGLGADFILCNEVDTTSRQKIEGYLAHKYAVTANLPAGHPYKTVAP